MSKSLVSFKESLVRIRDTINDINVNAAQALKDAAVRARHETIRCAMMVILSGFFESFMRNSADEFIAELCARKVPFDDLPDRIRATHFMGGANILLMRAKKEKSTRPMSDSALIVQRLASVVSAMPYELVSEAFGETKANPSAQIVKEFLGRFGIEKPSEKLAEFSGFSQSGLHTNFGSFIALRNECAHTGTAGNVPTGGEIADYCDFLEKVATAITDILNAYFSSPTLGVAPGMPPPPANGRDPGPIDR
jgi:RiboL-PSP-HEPN